MKMIKVKYCIISSFKRGETVKLILVRHGETYSNQKSQFLGFSESQLTRQGKEMSLFIAQALKNEEVDKIYCSPSKRVIDTLEPFIKEHSEILVEKVEALREINFGKFEKRDFLWIKKHYPQEIEKMLQEKEAYSYPNGESLQMMHKRMSAWLTNLIHKEEQKKRESTYLIATHGGIIRSILSELLVGDVSLHWHFKIDLGSISIVNIAEGFAVIEQLNQK